MRKSAIMVFVLVLFSASMAFAVPEENCGCGLGSMILEGQDGLISQLAATVTNGISGNQTFGITTGTLGCEKADSIVMNEKVNIFVAENMDNLAIDIASGQGETLDALADIERPSLHGGHEPDHGGLCQCQTQGQAWLHDAAGSLAGGLALGI